MSRVDLIKMRCGTAATWTSVNPILALGELGFETDTLKSKLGDGSTAWASLSYTKAGTVSTNANLTGPITSSGNATSIASQTGTGSTFAMSAGPTFAGTVTFATGTFSGNMFCGATSVSGSAAGDGCFARSTNTGYCYLGSNGAQYFGFNGALFQFVGGGASFNGSLTVTGSGSQIQVCRRSDSAAAWTIYSGSGELNFLSNLGGATTTVNTSGDWSFGAKASIVGKLNLGTVTNYASNALAIAGGLAAGDVYRNGDNLCVVH